MLLTKHGTVINGDEWIFHISSIETVDERLVRGRLELLKELILNLSG